MSRGWSSSSKQAFAHFIKKKKQYPYIVRGHASKKKEKKKVPLELQHKHAQSKPKENKLKPNLKRNITRLASAGQTSRRCRKTERLPSHSFIHVKRPTDRHIPGSPIDRISDQHGWLSAYRKETRVR
jgi:hypothetical protein